MQKSYYVLIILLFGLACSVACSQKENTIFVDEDGFEYVIKNDGIIVTGYQGNKENIIIPDKINNLPVIAIGEYAFHRIEVTAWNLNIDTQWTLSCKRFKKLLQKMQLTTWSPSGIERFKQAEDAFYNNRLTNVIIPDSVKTIGGNAFSGNNLTNIVIPDSVETIESSAFVNNQLTNVIIPNSVKTIGKWAFCDNKLKGAKEPFSIMVYKNEVTIIGYNRDEKDVVIPREIKGLPVVAIACGAFDVPFYHMRRKMELTSIVIPKSVKIDEYVFDSNTEIIRK